MQRGAPRLHFSSLMISWKISTKFRPHGARLMDFCAKQYRECSALHDVWFFDGCSAVILRVAQPWIYEFHGPRRVRRDRAHVKTYEKFYHPASLIPENHKYTITRRRGAMGTLSARSKLNLKFVEYHASKPLNSLRAYGETSKYIYNESEESSYI